MVEKMWQKPRVERGNVFGNRFPTARACPRAACVKSLGTDGRSAVIIYTSMFEAG